MKKIFLILVTIIAVAFVFGLTSTAFAEESATETTDTAPEQKAEVDADYIANVAVDKILAATEEKESTSSFAEWVNKYKAEIISAISGGIGLIAVALLNYIKKGQSVGAISQIKLFSKLQGESEAIQTAVSKIDDNSAEFTALKQTVAKQAETIDLLKAEIKSSQNETSNAVKNIAEMLFKAYQSSNLGENIKDAIAVNYNKIANYDATQKSKVIEKAKAVLSEVITNIDSAKA